MAAPQTTDASDRPMPSALPATLPSHTWSRPARRSVAGPLRQS